MITKIKNILTIEELYDLTKHPKINEISLELLREYYEKYLYPYEYSYDIKYKDNNKTSIKIIIKFDKDKFCHLLAIEKIFKQNTNKNNLKNYKGNLGWDNIKKNILTINTLKTTNLKLFKDNKNKFIFFYLIPKIMKNPIIIKYEKQKVQPKTQIESKFIFYEKNTDAYIHLGCDVDNNGYYYPRSFFIEKNNNKKYIESQDETKINKKKMKKIR